MGTLFDFAGLEDIHLLIIELCKNLETSQRVYSLSLVDDLRVKLIETSSQVSLAGRKLTIKEKFVNAWR